MELKPKFKSKWGGSTSEDWTPERRRKQSELLRQIHQQKLRDFALLDRTPPPLTPEELAELDAEQRERELSAADFIDQIWSFSRRNEKPVGDLFAACEIDFTRLDDVLGEMHAMCMDPGARKIKRSRKGRELQSLAAKLAYTLRRLACEHVPPTPLAQKVFALAGHKDPGTMREVATTLFTLCPDPDVVELLKGTA